MMKSIGGPGLRLMPRILMIYPFVEIIAYFMIIPLIGVANAFFFGLMTFVLGSFLLKNAGALSLNVAMKYGQNPSLVTTSLTMMAGFLLLLPGFVTDFLGLLLLFVCLIKLLLTKRSPANRPASSNAVEEQSEGETIDGEYHLVDKKESDKH